MNFNVSASALPLLCNDKRATNNFFGLSDEERWLAETYLPLVVVETHPEAFSEIGIAVKVYGVKGFLRILESSTLPTQIRLLSQIFEVMPKGVRQKLSEIDS